MKYDQATEEALLDALNAVDTSIGVLMMSRKALVAVLDAAETEASPTATMGGPVPADCPHVHTTEKNLMGGVQLKFCQDCGDQLE